MTTVFCPFAMAAQQGIPVLEIADRDPAKADELLAEFVRQAQEAMKGQSHVLYRLQGAEPQFTTPMQYGGIFLECDRQILASATADQHVTLWVEGGEGTYLDFVSDLPASTFAWDATATGFTEDQMRSLRSGALNPHGIE